MDNRVKEKFNDLNSYVEELEAKVKKGTIVNCIIYGAIVILFLIYAVVIPREVDRYTSPEEGPETLVSLIEGSIPDDKDLLDQAKSEIPTLVQDGLDQIWNMVPTGEAMLFDGMNGMADKMVDSIKKEAAPDLTAFLVGQVALIKEKHPELTSDDAKEMFNETARIHLRETLDEMVKNGHMEILNYKLQLHKYRKPDSQMTAKELAEKRVLLSFIRLGDDAEYRDQMADMLVQALQNTYGKLTAK